MPHAHSLANVKPRSCFNVKSPSNNTILSQQFTPIQSAQKINIFIFISMQIHDKSNFSIWTGFAITEDRITVLSAVWSVFKSLLNKTGRHSLVAGLPSFSDCKLSKGKKTWIRNLVRILRLWQLCSKKKKKKYLPWHYFSHCKFFSVQQPF